MTFVSNHPRRTTTTFSWKSGISASTIEGKHPNERKPAPALTPPIGRLQKCRTAVFQFCPTDERHPVPTVLLPADGVADGPGGRQPRPDHQQEPTLPPHTAGGDVRVDPVHSGRRQARIPADRRRERFHRHRVVLESAEDGDAAGVHVSEVRAEAGGQDQGEEWAGGRSHAYCVHHEGETPMRGFRGCGHQEQQGGVQEVLSEREEGASIHLQVMMGVGSLVRGGLGRNSRSPSTFHGSPLTLPVSSPYLFGSLSGPPISSRFPVAPMDFFVSSPYLPSQTFLDSSIPYLP
jgi:hypothetical protein